MRMLDIIEKKRDRNALTDSEIAFFVKGVSDGAIPSYQISALLMACYLNGMNDAETASLTYHMAHTGGNIDLSFAGGAVVDKHSSGGVGDKTTLVVAPIAAACGLKIAKMSGRGLGFSGGTIDKLESIPGFRVSLTREEFIRCIRSDGLSIISQTSEVAPVDKILYALRDVTGTVSSIPLIASSIMSKKLAIKSDAVVLDVKAGSGAFMKTPDTAIELAEKMVTIGRLNGRKTIAAVTNMDQPLGYTVGNALEVAEAVRTLRGEGPADFAELCYTIASLMLTAGGTAADADTARKMAEDSIACGAAYEKFRRMVVNQGGDAAYTDDISRLPAAKTVIAVTAERAGYVTAINAGCIGRAAVEAGAGRYAADDIIDSAAGIVLNKKCGDHAAENEPLFYIHAESVEKAENAKKTAAAAFTLEDAAPRNRKPAVYAIIDDGGVHLCE